MKTSFDFQTGYYPCYGPINLVLKLDFDSHGFQHIKCSLSWICYNDLMLKQFSSRGATLTRLTCPRISFLLQYGYKLSFLDSISVCMCKITIIACGAFASDWRKRTSVPDLAPWIGVWNICHQSQWWWGHRRVGWEMGCCNGQRTQFVTCRQGPDTRLFWEPPL